MNQKVDKSQSKSSLKRKSFLLAHQDMNDTEAEEDLTRDWWSRYFASVDAVLKESVKTTSAIITSFTDNHRKLLSDSVNSWPKTNKKSANKVSPKKNTNQSSGQSVNNKSDANLIQIYGTELESCPQFNGFKEYLQSFELYRGKRSANDQDDQSRLCGIFKVNIAAPLPLLTLFMLNRAQSNSIDIRCPVHCSSPDSLLAMNQSMYWSGSMWSRRLTCTRLTSTERLTPTVSLIWGQSGSATKKTIFLSN